MDLSDILENISDIAYDIDVKENYKWAVEELRMNPIQARKFAEGAAKEQRQLDRLALKSKLVNKKLARISERRRLLEASKTCHMPKCIEKKEQEIDNLLDMINNIKL